MSKTSVDWQLGTMSAVKGAPNLSLSLTNWTTWLSAGRSC